MVDPTIAISVISAFAPAINSALESLLKKTKKPQLTQEDLQEIAYLIKSLAEQQDQITKVIEATSKKLETLESRNNSMSKKIESYNLLIQGLEARNAYLARSVSEGQSRIRVLFGICIAIGLIAAAAFVVAVTTNHALR